MSGLNALNGYSVTCHYREQEDGELTKCAREKGPLVALREEVGLRVTDGKTEVVGGCAYVFTKSKKEKLKNLS